jgi:protein SCO1/2
VVPGHLTFIGRRAQLRPASSGGVENMKISLHRTRRRRFLGGFLALVGAGLGLAANAAEAEHDHAHHHEDPSAAGHDHSAHQAQVASAGSALAQQRMASYQAPALTLIDQRGRKVDFNKTLDDGRPVILNFIFTSCTTICPVMTQILLQVQAKLGDDRGRVHMVSVSIDPEYDTPARLMDYAKQNQTGAQWDFYTGSSEDSIRVQKAFDAYRGGKMNHEAVVLLRGPRGSNWTRLDGFASADQILNVYRSLAG